MKSLKLVMIATLLTFTAVSIAKNTEELKSKPNKIVNITFDQAVQIPGLVVAIYQQVNPDFLDKLEQLYIVQVEYNDIHYRILASRRNWIQFFRLEWKYVIETDRLVRKAD